MLDLAEQVDKLVTRARESERKLEVIRATVRLAEAWSEDQEIGLTPHEVCLAAMKDVRRIVDA